MMRQIIISCLLLLICAINYSSTYQSANELQAYLHERVNEFKLNFHRSFESTRIRRKKHDNYLLTLPSKGALIEEHLKVASAIGVSPNGNVGNVTTWTCIETPEHTLLFWGQPNGILSLAEFRLGPNGLGPQLFMVARHHERNNGIPVKSKYFNYNHQHWLVIMFRNAYREYFAVYQLVGNTFVRRQTIETDLMSDFDLIMNKGKVYMSVSSYMRKTQVGSTLRAALKLYEWRHTQFDFMAEQKTYSATSVRMFNMGGTLYLAVAQAINDTMINKEKHLNSDGVEFASGSMVFVYNARDEERLTYAQIIRTYSASQVEHFKVDGNDYLIFISPHEDARIFWWGGDQFLEFQILRDTRFAKSVAIKRLPNDEVMIAILFPDRIKFFTETIHSQYEKTSEFSDHPGINFQTVTLFSHLNAHYYALFTFYGGQISTRSIWNLKLSTYQTNKPIDYDPLVHCLFGLEESLSAREVDLQKVVSRVDKVWVTNRLQNVSAPVVVRGELKSHGTNGFHVANLLMANDSLTNIPHVTNTQVKSHITRANITLNNILNSMNQIVFKSSNQTIIGPITFVNPIRTYNASMTNIANENMMVNKIPFGLLSSGILKIDGQQIITGHLTFNQNVKANVLQINGLINKLNISDALLSDWPYIQEINGIHRYFDVSLHSDLLLNQRGSINGISPHEFVTTFGVNQPISGSKTFQMLASRKNIQVDGLTNGRNLNGITSKAVWLDAPDQILSGRLTFEVPINAGNLRLRGLINNLVSISELVLNAVKTHGNQRIVGRKTFLAPIRVTNDILLGGNVNFINLNRDVITTNTVQQLTGNFIYKSPTVFNKDVDVGLVNGVDLSGEALLRNTPLYQHINVGKTFNEDITVLGNITMTPRATIDTVDPSELQRLMIDKNNLIFDLPLYFDHLVIKGQVRSRFVNNYLINDLPRILWLKSASQVITNRVKFSGLTKVISSTSQFTNGFKVPHDFVLKTGQPEVITGPKSFMNQIMVVGNINVKEGKKVNGVDLSWFNANIVKKVGNQIISGVKTFRNFVGVNGSVVTRSVNLMNLNKDVLLTRTPQTVNVNLRFMSPTFINRNLQVNGNIDLKGTLNNISLSRYINDMVMSNDFQSIMRPIRNKIFSGGVKSNNISAHGTISGINIEEMKRRVVTLDTPQIIISTKNFTGRNFFNNHLNCTSLNGLNIIEHVKQVIFKDQKTLVRGQKRFAGEVRMISNLQVTGRLNGIDIQSLNRKTMSRRGGNTIVAPMVFTSNLTLGGLNMEAPALLDGLRVSDLVLLNEDVRLDGHIRLMNSVTVNGNINIAKSVNYCDLRRMANEAIYLDSVNMTQIISGAKRFQSMQVNGNVLVKGPINGINLNNLASKVVTKSGNQELKAPLIFGNEVHVEHLRLNGLVNSKNLSFILNDAVSKSQPQEITGRKKFYQTVIMNGTHLNVRGNVDVEGNVNGIDVNQLDATAVRRDQNIEIHGVKTFAGAVTFKRNIDIHGLMNGIRVVDDLVRTNTSELIQGVTTFKDRVLVKNNFQVNGFIDGIDLVYFFHNKVSLDANEVVSASINITNPVSVDELIVRQTINGIPISAFVTINGNHIISGQKTFSNDIHITGNLMSRGQFNGINLHDLRNRAVSLLKPESLPLTTTFTREISLNHLSINGLLNGLDVSDMANFFVRLTHSISQTTDLTKKRLGHQEDQLQALFNAHVHKLRSKLKYFSLLQQFNQIGERFVINTWPSPLFDIYPTKSLMLWKVNNESKYCSQYSTEIYDVSDYGRLILDSARSDHGRYISITENPIMKSINTLLLWTNTTNCKTSLYEGTRMQTFHIDELHLSYNKRGLEDSGNYYRNTIQSPFLRDAKMFVSNNDMYVVLANNYNKVHNSYHTNSTVIWLDPKTRKWNQIQNIETFGVNSIDVITFTSGSFTSTFLAIANGLYSFGRDAQSVIMQWNPRVSRFEVNTIVLTTNPSATIFVRSHDGHLFAVFANRKPQMLENICIANPENEKQPTINIYHYDGHGFKYMQNIEMPGVVSLETFHVSQDTYLIAASQQKGITYVYQLKKTHFELLLSFSTPGVEHVKSFWSNNGGLQLAVASNKPGHSKILRAVISGPNINKHITMEEVVKYFEKYEVDY